MSCLPFPVGSAAQRFAFHPLFPHLQINHTMEILEHKIKSVNQLYRHLDRHVFAYKRRSGLSCVNGCGLCCLNKELNTTITEFLPAAYRLFQSGQTDSVLEKIRSKQDPICVLFNPFTEGGNCSVYSERGLLCRLFGFSVKTDKNAVPSLITCHLIKETIDNEQLDPSLQAAPNMSSYYMKLYGIDPVLSVRYMPINQAIKEAIEQVLSYFAYRKKPA
jgi:Fe-S-cluster containining protein